MSIIHALYTAMAKDIYHDTVRTALEKDGWTITDDPFNLYPAWHEANFLQ